ncbi:MAG TPA: outer-membrane lipoprotein carrier protein LolA [Thermoanaerobaculales bacterium]|nr:outer-membrane lipoprotein carrier protein LolA [Thermoanaerobaculales bacterium]HPA80018.1 outer-membrane lipoprotein carrier protein LolA [Thermoanaerobaculales bacterium]HQL30163.1 outer-membrane lipoprotein carrier protein LolA [Thermoanaerobaculales bacterium]HQN95307.1 outer-membrane lipoprotein carrier protein LolA [Thermoanaerobaculales bacterium]HQP42338.1 outer-membrane lipoprotein carrier protein LolA [Thermoanaerobaculales bacterium]
MARRRRPTGVVAAVATAALLATGPAASQEGPIAVLESLAGALRARPVWTASYHQEFVPAGMTAGEQVDGDVWVGWPDRAHFRSGDPTLRIMGLDGRLVRLVDLDLPTCEDHRLDDDEWARIPLAAVLDPQAAVDRFTVLGIGERGVALEPRRPGGVARVEVHLRADNLPLEVVVIDPQGATNRLKFGAWTPLEQPPPGGWLPPAPAGVECTGEGAGPGPGGDADRGRLRR